MNESVNDKGVCGTVPGLLSLNALLSALFRYDLLGMVQDGNTFAQSNGPDSFHQTYTALARSVTLGLLPGKHNLARPV